MQIDEERAAMILRYAEAFLALDIKPSDPRARYVPQMRNLMAAIDVQIDVTGANDETLQQLRTRGEELIDQVDRILVEANAVQSRAAMDAQEKRARESGAEGGKAGGFKGGRPSKKPTRADIRKAYDVHLACGSASEARANLAKDLRKTGASERTVRNWLKDAGI